MNSCKPEQLIESDTVRSSSPTISIGGGTNRKKTLIVGDSIVKNIEGWRLNKIIKSSVAVK